MHKGVALLSTYFVVIERMSELDRKRSRILDQALHGDYAEAFCGFRGMIAEVPDVPSGWATHFEFLDMLSDGVCESFEKSCNVFLRSHDTAMRNLLQLARCRLDDESAADDEFQEHARDVVWIVRTASAISRMQFLVRELTATKRMEDDWLEYIQDLFVERPYSTEEQ